MIPTRSHALTIVACSLLALAGGAMLGGGRGGAGEHLDLEASDEPTRQSVPLEKVPDSVKHAIENHSAGAILERAAKFRENDAGFMEVWAKNKDGDRMLFRTTDDGRLCEVTHHEPKDRLPADIAAAVHKQLPKGDVVGVERFTSIRFEVDVKDAGGAKRIVIWPDGRVVMRDAPPPVPAPAPAKTPAPPSK